MRLMYINNDGGGFADHIDIPADTTVSQFFAERLPNCKAEDYLIRVNRQPVSADQILREGDRISISPTKLAGAFAAA